ncbi:MAG: DUF3995 domain-containing protein [Devosia sp.]|nr:DUF3995 domain-containing protein [Devosia sp.]
MNMIIASIVFVILLAVALAHLLWSIGSRWPIKDPELLARTVIGRPGVSRVPRLASLVVAVLVLAAGVSALSLADHDAGDWWLTAIGVVLAIVFIGRGALGYTAGWRAQFPLEPFATNDRRVYSPLCLIVGAGFLILVIMRLL